MHFLLSKVCFSVLISGGTFSLQCEGVRRSKPKISKVRKMKELITLLNTRTVTSDETKHASPHKVIWIAECLPV